MPKPSIQPAPSLNVEAIRAQFPILRTQIHGHPLIYLDNAATTQKPQSVIDAIRHYYESENANIHRGVHTLSQQATSAYEEVRRKIARFIHAADEKEIIFTRGTTESINLVASSYGRAFLKPGDEIILSAMEHHSNIVPWQLIAAQTGAAIRVIPINDRGELLMDEFDRLLSDRTRIVSIVHVSNSLGTINPVRRIIEKAHGRGAVVLVDGAQSVAHAPVDVHELDADFYAFSGHKIYGPTGIGILFGKAALLDAMPPYQGGGDMISSVTFEKTSYAALPHKFEAGTPNIAGGIGLGAAVDFISSVGFQTIAAHEKNLLQHATQLLEQISGVRIIGAAGEKAGVLSFVVDRPNESRPISSLDVGMRLDAVGIAVRTGHHCCQPVMDRFQIPATARASFALYNTIQEIEFFAEALRNIVKPDAGAAQRAPATPAQSLQFPPASAASPAAAAEQLVEMFEFLDDWEQRNQALIDEGEKLLPLPADFKTEPNRVRGCMSTVHLVARKKPGSPDTFEFLADSDAMIVRGLIWLLQKIYAGQSAQDVADFDIESFLKRLGLDTHLSMGRRNGLAGMIQRIRAEAAKILASGK